MLLAIFAFPRKVLRRGFEYHSRRMSLISASLRRAGMHLRTSQSSPRLLRVIRQKLLKVFTLERTQKAFPCRRCRAEIVETLEGPRFIRRCGPDRDKYLNRGGKCATSGCIIADYRATSVICLTLKVENPTRLHGLAVFFL